MPGRGYPPASWIGMVLLLLALTTWPTPLLASGGDGPAQQEKTDDSAGAPTWFFPETPIPALGQKSNCPERAPCVYRAAWLGGLEAGTPSDEHPDWRGADFNPHYQQAGVDEGASTGSAPGPWQRLGRDLDLIREDYAHYYTWPNLGEVALSIGLAAPLANTRADNAIRHWYQTKVRSGTTDSFANGIGLAGELWIVGAMGMEAWALSGKAGDDYSTDSGLWEWSNRSLRSMAVGTPPLLLMYVALGASRPDTGHSSWHPFQDIHGASGHTFFGAVPFLTAAEMTDNEFLKVPLFLGSFLTGWSRINNDRHYFSQVALGWWMAYLSVKRVEDTQAERKSWSVVPTFDEGPGVGVLIRY